MLLPEQTLLTTLPHSITSLIEVTDTWHFWVVSLLKILSTIHILLQALPDFLEQQGAASSLDSFPTTALDAPIVPQHPGLKGKILSRKLDQDSRHNHCWSNVTAIGLSEWNYRINNNKYYHKHNFIFIFISTFIYVLSISIYIKKIKTTRGFIPVFCFVICNLLN